MYLFRLSKNEKDRVFLVVRLVKMIKQRQTCLQTRTSFTIARLVKTQRWACPKGRLQNKHMLSSSSLTKIKRYWSAMTGEKLGEPHSFNGSKSLLNMTLCPPYHIGLGCFIHRSHHHGLAKPSTFGVMLPIHHISVVICSRDVVQKESTVSHPLPYIILHPPMIATLNHMSQIVFTSIKIISSVPCH